MQVHLHGVTVESFSAAFWTPEHKLASRAGRTVLTLCDLPEEAVEAVCPHWVTRQIFLLLLCKGRKDISSC